MNYPRICGIRTYMGVFPHTVEYQPKDFFVREVTQKGWLYYSGLGIIKYTPKTQETSLATKA